MKSSKSLFGKADRPKKSPPGQMSQFLQIMAAEIPRLPPEHHPILERIVREANAAGVSSPQELSGFLSAHPDLQLQFATVMMGARGPDTQQSSPVEDARENPPTFSRLQFGTVDVSSAEELQAHLLQNPAEMIEVFTVLLERAQREGDGEGEVAALGYLGIAHAEQGQLPKAIFYFERHLKISRQLENWQGVMEDYRNLGRAHGELADYDRAQRIYDEALNLARKQQNQDWIIYFSYSLASVYAQLGDMKRAAELTEEAKALENRRGK